MSVIERRDDKASGDQNVGRFLRGTITERFFPRRPDGEVSGAGVALAASPITVTLTDAVRSITETIPATERVTEIGAAITAYTTTIPAITRTITGEFTVITDNLG